MSEKGGYNVNEKTDPTQNTIRLMDTAVNGLTVLFASEMHRVDERQIAEEVASPARSRKRSSVDAFSRSTVAIWRQIAPWAVRRIEKRP